METQTVLRKAARPMGNRPVVLPLEFPDRPVVTDDVLLPALDGRIKTLNEDIAAVNIQIRRFLKDHMLTINGRITFDAPGPQSRARLALKLRHLEDKRDVLGRLLALASAERLSLQSRRQH